MKRKEPMDRIIEKPVWWKRRNTLWLALSMLFLLLLWLILWGGGRRTLKVDRERVVFSTVHRGIFFDNIPITGVVEPIQSIYITAAEGGNVEEIYVEDGAMVSKGTPLIRLTNANLMLDFMNRETQIVEQINNLRNTRLVIEQNKRALSEQLIDQDFQLLEAQRQFRVDSAIYRDSAISRNDYEASSNAVSYLRQKRNFTRANIQREEAIQNAQLHRIDNSIMLMERNLEAIRRNLDNLTIKAPLDGQLTGFNHYLGETKQRGEALGQVDVTSGYLIRCNVDEFYLNRVQIGQEASFQFGGQTHQLLVSKVLPQVSNGQFQIEMHFKEQLPENIRRGQSMQIRLFLSNESEALMVDRGGFFQSTGGQWVFVLAEEGKAVRRAVRMGRQNTDYIEVLEGLEEGESIIANSYSSYGEAEELEIQ